MGTATRSIPYERRSSAIFPKTKETGTSNNGPATAVSGFWDNSRNQTHIVQQTVQFHGRDDGNTGGFLKYQQIAILSDEEGSLRGDSRGDEDVIIGVTAEFSNHRMGRHEPSACLVPTCQREGNCLYMIQIAGKRDRKISGQPRVSGVVG